MDYNSFWQEMFGYPANMPEFAKERRKRYIETRWTEENRAKRLEEIKNNCLKRKVERLPSLIRKYLFFVDNKEIDRRYIIRFKLYKPDGSAIAKCYDVCILYELANIHLKDGFNKEIWIDPEEEIRYDERLIARIKKIYDRVAPDKPSAIIYQQNIELTKK
jgi:hypothetical protein